MTCTRPTNELLRVDERGRVRTGAGRRAELLAEYDRSGLSGAAFGLRAVGRDQVSDLRQLAAAAAQRLRRIGEDARSAACLATRQTRVHRERGLG